MRKLPIIAGLTFALGGAASGAYHNIQRAPLDEIPAVQELNNRLDFLFEAESEWLRIPEIVRVNYIPQNKRADYSVAQAHSEVEHTYQRLETARGIVKRLAKSPEVIDYRKKSNSEFLSYVAGFLGLILAGSGLIRRD